MRPFLKIFNILLFCYLLFMSGVAFYRSLNGEGILSLPGWIGVIGMMVAMVINGVTLDKRHPAASFVNYSSEMMYRPIAKLLALSGVFFIWTLLVSALVQPHGALWALVSLPLLAASFLSLRRARKFIKRENEMLGNTSRREKRNIAKA